MTDKQIIIHGVDVSGCEFAEISKMIRPNQVKPSVKCKILKVLNQVFHCTCQYNKNCNYKQLKRKEQECEELKDKVERLTILGMDLNQSNEVLRKSFFTADKNKDNWREKAEKLSKTLTKIKEIAEDHCVFCQKIDPETFDMSECKLCNHSKILQKISEVEDVSSDS